MGPCAKDCKGAMPVGHWYRDILDCYAGCADDLVADEDDDESSSVLRVTIMFVIMSLLALF